MILLPHPPPAQASGAARGCLVSWIGASESLVDASGTIFSRLQRSLVPMLWFGSQLSGVLGRSRLDFSMFQKSVAWRSHLNPPHHAWCPGVSNQCAFKLLALNIQDLNTCFNMLKGGPAMPPTQYGVSLVGTMLALFFGLGRCLGAFCTSCCACYRSWSFLVRLGALQARFWRGFGGAGHGFRGPKR